MSCQILLISQIYILFFMRHMHTSLCPQYVFRLLFVFSSFWMQLQSMGLSFRTAVIRKRHYSGMHRLQVIWFTLSNSILLYIINLISYSHLAKENYVPDEVILWIYWDLWLCVILSLYDINLKCCKILLPLRDINCS